MLPHVQLTPKPRRYPSEIKTDGLVFWLSAQEYSAGASITSGQTVKTVNNQFRASGLIAGGGTTNVVSWRGKTAFDFRTGGNYFIGTDNFPITGTTPSTIIAVGQPVNSTGGGNGSNYHIGVSWGGTAANRSRALATDGSGVLRAIWYNNDPTFSSSTIGINKPSVMIIRDVSATSALGNISQNGRTNDTTQQTHAAIDTGTGAFLTIGQWMGDYINYPFGYISEVLIYNRSLSDAEINTVMTYFEGLYVIKGFSSFAPFSSPTEAASGGTPAGTYWFQGGSMSSPRQLVYSGANYYDSSAYVRGFSAPYRSTATVNELGLNIPFTKFLVQRSDAVYRGLVRFNSTQAYNATANTGIIGDSAINTANWSPRTTVATKVILGAVGGHGIYSLAQNACSWPTADSAIGAGWNGSLCGTNFPNDLVLGTGVSDSATYTNLSGTWEHWLSW